MSFIGVSCITWNIIASCIPINMVLGKNLSCETQLLLTIEDIAKNLDIGSEIELQIFDFSKAFDKVPQQRLLSKLHYYGIKGKALAWIISWLTPRTQRVLVDGEAFNGHPRRTTGHGLGPSYVPTVYE